MFILNLEEEVEHDLSPMEMIFLKMNCVECLSEIIDSYENVDEDRITVSITECYEDAVEITIKLDEERIIPIMMKREKR